ncbi:hypothetical protein KQX54_017298 [Cotesia glomerata]|uniref:Uncharacterized protein n=1 Tax=Cotesia glomerata TaxID=32391 RepID=A0AAV7ICP9_COTGL|nr:hypothetical protein KQX54_017298 [Cotesia glomerata]
MTMSTSMCGYYTNKLGTFAVISFDLLTFHWIYPAGITLPMQALSITGLLWSILGFFKSGSQWLLHCTTQIQGNDHLDDDDDEKESLIADADTRIYYNEFKLNIFSCNFHINLCCADRFINSRAEEKVDFYDKHFPEMSDANEMTEDRNGVGIGLRQEVAFVRNNLVEYEYLHRDLSGEGRIDCKILLEGISNTAVSFNAVVYL